MKKSAEKIPWAHRGKKLGPPPHVEYNPMMGTRLDLEVHTDATPEEAERTRVRWRERRIAYLRTLMADASDDAKQAYKRELKILVDNRSGRL
jgi:hypothetical protein